MSQWQPNFIDRCAQLEGATVGEGAFTSGPAVWVGRREIAHLDDDDTVDIRLTKGVIRVRRPELSGDERVRFRPGGSDWVEFQVRHQSDCDDVLSLVRDAIAANLPSAPPGAPPTGPELARRRRFH